MQFKKIMIGASLALSIGLFAACGNDTATKDTKESATKTTESSVDLNKLDLPQLNDKVTDDEYLVELVTTEENGTRLYSIRKNQTFPRTSTKSSRKFCEAR